MRSLVRAATVVAVSALVVLIAVPAFAHVTVRADDTSPGGFAKYTVRVPNESEDAATVRVEIQLPEGFEEPRYQPAQGWEIDISDGVLTIEGGRIEPGQFQEFAFSARNPEQPGDVQFPAIQVYEDGEEVRWVGPADSDEPAPVVTIEDAAGGDGDGDGGATAEATAEATAAAEVTEPADATDATEATEEPADTETDEAQDVAAAPPSDDDSGSNVVSIIALIAGLLGLGLGGAAFARTRSVPRA